MAKKGAAKSPSERPVFPGADERTPSRAQFFSWINNTNEGATEAQTLVNFAFFAWLREEYGMQLDIYAFDAGALDSPNNAYGRLDTAKFQRQFPRGFGPIAEKAQSLGFRLGVWGGPDGFGNTDAEVRARIALMASLCRDFHFALFKFDGVCGTLRKDKQDYFVQMMQECRKHAPDLVLLNHRLDLGKGMPYATTSLLGGDETYIDILMCNKFTAPHHRAGALSRELPVGLSRLQEDHGVCLSSCLDFWDDDLVLQAFNRCLILAPELYGNPWFLRDDEYPKLARIFNLHRCYRAILVHALRLPEGPYGPLALSRGDGATRFITMRNLEWEPEVRKVTLSEEIGLQPTPAPIVVRQFHPTERVLSEFPYGATVEVVVWPFRACLVIAAAKDAPLNRQEVTITGVDYAVVRDVPGRPVMLALLGMPGTHAHVSLAAGSRQFTRASLAGKAEPALAQGKGADVTFPGQALALPWHRKLAELAPCDVPADAEALYEATCFAADNNCLEARCMARSGPTRVPAVQAARDAFFNQPLFKARAPWDRFAFEDDPATRFFTAAYPEASLRIDLGAVIAIDTLVVKGAGEGFEKGEVTAEVSIDLATWIAVKAPVHDCKPAPASGDARDIFTALTPEHPDVPFDPKQDPRFFGETRFPLPVGKQRYVEISAPGGTARYFRIHDVPAHVLKVGGRRAGAWISDRSRWRMNYLFERFSRASFDKAYHASFSLNEVPAGSYVCVAIFGEHGEEGAYAALKINGKPVGAPDRALSYQAHPWEHVVRATTAHYTYFFPLKPEYQEKPINVYVLGVKGNPRPMFVEVWVTGYTIPFKRVELLLE